MSSKTADKITEQIAEEGVRWSALKDEIKKEVVGQDHIIDRLCIGLLCNGHILLEGLPGLAKTTVIKAMAKALGVDFARIQFTPDLLPSDVIGTLMYNPKTHEFQTKKGPIFTNLLLADEINRAPAKVQSALLEAMQEHQVTIGEETFQLDDPFLVLATQNPIEQEGTYRLPEAQVDRFLLKLTVPYPSPEEEKQIIEKAFSPEPIQKVLTKKDIALSRSLVDDIYVDDKISNYIIDIVFATRNPQEYGLESIAHYIECGASPRGTLTLHHASRAHAFLRKRYFVTPDDVKAVLHDVLRHRILVSYEAEAENVTSETILNTIIETIPSP